MKKLNQAKADGGIEKRDINDTGVKDGEEQQNQATGNNNGCKEPVINNKEENPSKKGVPCSVPCLSRPWPGPLPTEHLDKKAKGDTETYEEATSTLSRLLNKYEEGNNRYQNLHRMIYSRTYPIKRAGQDEKVQ